MIILTYHKISNVENFEKQIDYLVSHGYNLLTLADFLDKISSANFSANDVLITFDDGDVSILENACPILEKFNCPAVVFVITSLIGTKQPFWWDEIQYYGGGSVSEAKMMGNADRLNLLDNLRSRNALAPLESCQLGIQDLQLLERKGINIANHSHTHPMFDRLTPTEIGDELKHSRQFFVRNGFLYGDILAYPNGNYTTEAEEVLNRHEMKLAFLFDHKVASKCDNPYRLSRLSVNDHTPMWKYKLILRGWHSRFLPFIKLFNRILH